MAQAHFSKLNRASFGKRLKSGLLALTLLAVQVASPVVAGFVAPATASAAAVSPTPNSNPSLSQSCGLDIALVIDNSNSIGNSEMNQIKSAMTGFTNALNGTPTQFSVTRFGSTASVINNFTSSVASTNAAINGIPTDGGGTNWEDGLIKANSTFDPRADKPNLVIFASDGNPTYHIGGGNGFSTSQADVDAAIVQANIIKSSGTRMLALGIGNNLSVDNLEDISGPNVNTGNVLTSDVITSDFDSLAADLATFAKQTCGGTITTTKLIDQDGNLQTTGDQSPASGWSFDINGSPSNPNPVSTDANGKTVAVPVNSGTYSVNEVTQPGYDLASATCSGASNNGGKQGNAVVGVVVGDESIVSCTFINTPSKGSVQVQKKLDANGNGTFEGGNSEAQAKSMFWNLDGGSNTTFGGTISNVSTGSHQVSENSVAGYHFVGWYQTGNTQASCTNPTGTTLPVNVTVNANQTAGVTLCNARDTGTIKIKKTVVNNNGGTLSPSDFQMHLTGEGVDLPGSPVAGSNSGTSFQVKTGTYTVSEDSKPGYSQTSLVCVNEQTQAVVANPVVLGADQQITCTVTNDDIAPTVTIVKNVVNPFGAPLPASAFNLFVDGQVVYSGISTTQFYAGQHTASETQQAGYELTDISGDCVRDGNLANLMLSLDGQATCTFTNTAIQPKLIVTKNVINDNSGTKIASDFQMTVTGNTAVVPNFPGNEWGQSVGLNEGMYSVGEVSHDGYTQSLSEGCNGTISIGQTKYCTITNDDIAHPSIEVVKYGPDTAHEGDMVWYSFYVTNTGDTVLTNVNVSDDIAQDESCNDTSLNPGESTWCSAWYVVPTPQTDNVENTVTATGSSISTQSDVTDTDNHVLDVLHPSIKVVKSGPATAPAGSDVTYTFTVTNSGDVALTGLTVVDSLTGDGNYVSGDANENGYLDLAETWIYQGVYSIPAAQTTDVVNTVEVCGYEPFWEENDDEVLVDSIRANSVIIRKPAACAEDTHTLTIPVKPEVIGDTDEPKLQVTGVQSNTSLLVTIAASSTILFGLTLAATRRKSDQ